MESHQELYNVEEIIKQELLEKIKCFSHVELKQFNKSDCKKKALKELGRLLPKYEKGKLSETAQCISNAMQSEVQERMRKKSREHRASNNAISESILNAFDSTIQLEDTDECLSLENTCSVNMENTTQTDTQADNVVNGHNDSITILKTTFNSCESSGKSPMSSSDTGNPKEQLLCCDFCKINTKSKKHYPMTRCTVCMVWYHDKCVGIGNDEPVGTWLCIVCRNSFTNVQCDVTTIKSDVLQLQECTKSILSAVNVLSSKLENYVDGLHDRITALSKQINVKDKYITDSIQDLQTSTDTVKSTFDQKANQILNKTATVIDKIKTQTEINKCSSIKTTSETVKQNSEPLSIPDQRAASSASNKQPMQVKQPKFRSVNHSKSVSSNKVNIASRPKINEQSIDLTHTTKSVISQPTLLVGSSLFKGIKNGNLKQNTTVRSFPGARTDTLAEKLLNYDISNCKTIILHVGGNDADNGMDLDSFSDSYVELLNSLEADNRRIIVSGLLPRQSVDLKPYNERLKAICEENDIQYIDHYNSFLLASGEMPESYFHKDKLHLRIPGTQKLLSNINKIHTITMNKTDNDRPSVPRRYLANRRPAYSVQHQHRLTHNYCHICARKGHATQDCWYNGRSNSQTEYFSR